MVCFILSKYFNLFSGTNLMYLYIICVLELKTGPNRVSPVAAELKLDENCALVKTLPRWKVVHKVFVYLTAGA